RAFVARGAAAVGLDDAFATIDTAELESAARLACLGLLERVHRGCGSLLDAFPRTIAAWLDGHQGATREDLAFAFAESPELDAYRALPSCAGAISLEEAFYRFAEREDAGGARVRLAECACAILRALVVTPRASFALPSFIARAPGGFYVV